MFGVQAHLSNQVGDNLARIWHEWVRKIGQGIDCLKAFPNEWNTGVYF